MTTRQLTEPEWGTIRELGRHVRYGSGERLASEGDDDQRVFAIVEGEIRILLTVLSGSERVVGVRRAGELIGEMAALDGSRRSASMVARGPVEAYVLSVHSFQEFLRLHSEASFNLLMVLASRLREVGQQHAVHSEDLAARVAWRLSQLGEDVGSTRLLLTQQELADWIGATREATARVLKDLRDAGLVSTGRGWIEIEDAVSLAAGRRGTA